jgi:predicted PurR-regulated permease PerM
VSALTTGRFRFAPILAATVFTVLLLILLGKTADIFLLLFIAVLVSLYLGAIADLVHRRSGLPRRAALFLSVMATLAAIVGLFWLLVPPIVEQTQELLRVLPGMVLNWERGIDAAITRMPALRAVFPPGEHRVLLAVYEQVAGYVSEIFPKLVSALHVAIQVVAVAIMSLYLALYPGLYRERLIALFPPVHRDLARNVLADLANTLRSWIVGQLLAMIVLAALTSIGLYLLRVPYWLTFGVFTGVVAIVPFFGTLVSTVLPALFVIGGNGGLVHALLVAGLGVVIHVFEGNVVAPLIMHRQVNLPPVITIMSVLIMGKLLGPVGLIVAVPTVAVFDVVIRRILINRVYEGRGFRRLVRDSAFVVRAPAMDGDLILPESDSMDILALVEARHAPTQQPAPNA